MRWVEIASVLAGLGIGYWLVSVFMHRGDAADEPRMPPAQEAAPETAGRAWHDVLEISEWATDEEVKAAYRSKVAQYHPDKVATMGAEIRALAALKTREINDAYREAVRRR